MVYFIDTNIGIGFSLFPDKFHSPCKNFIHEVSQPIYWSTGVFEEFNEKFEEILEVIDDFFNSISHSLSNRKYSFLNKDEFGLFVLNKTRNIDLDINKKSKLIDFFWEDFITIYDLSIEEFYDLIDEFSLYIPNLLDEQKDILLNKVHCHDCGLDNYRKYLNLKNRLIQCGVHDPDYKFVLDAHNLAKSIMVIFVTCDDKMVDAIISNNLSNQLDISKFEVLN